MQKTDLAELRRLHEAANKPDGWTAIEHGNFARAAFNALPALLDELEAAEQERDAAKAEVARQWIVLTEIAEEVENYADCDDNEEGIANRPNLAMRVQMMADKATQCNPQAYAWLAARDASMKLEGAAEELERLASVNQHRMLDCNDLTERAAQLRREAEGK